MINRSIRANLVSASDLFVVKNLTPGLAESGKALVLDNNKDIAGIRNLSVQNLNVGGSLLTASAAEINTVDTTPGTAQAGKALVFDINIDISNIHSLSASNLFGTLQTTSQPHITSLGTLTGLSTNSLTLNGTLITASAAKLNYNNINIAGIAEANKALILDTNLNITNINSLNAINLLGTLETANQPNITTLTGVTLIGSSDITEITGTLQTASQPNITSLPGIISIGSSDNTEITGTLQTASQPNITSLPGIISIGSSDNTDITGTLQTASQPNITTLAGIVSIGLNNNTTITGTLQTASQPNIISVGTLTSLSTGNITLNGTAINSTATELNYNHVTTTGIAEASKALIVDTNIDISNINSLTATNLNGTLLTASQPNITTLAGVTSMGLNSSTTITGTLQTASQPNITSVGTLTSLSTGNITLNGTAINSTATELNYNHVTTTGIAEASKALIVDTNIDISNINSLTATNLNGTLLTASQPNITTLAGVTSIGLNNSTTVTGTLQTTSQPNITTLSGVMSIGLNNSTTINGTLQTASQPNITSVGTLTSLSTGNITLNGTLITSSAAELNYNDITTVGTAEASKALILDSNKDITGIRNLTIAGNLIVSGTTMTVNSTQINFTDNILQLNSAPAGSGYDSGIIIQRFQNASNTILGDVIGQTAKESYIAASVTVSTIVLPVSANATNSYYNNWWIRIQSATTGSNQIRQVLDYVGSTKTITLATNFTTTPTGTIVVNLYNKGYSSLIWQEANKRFVTAYSAQDTSAGALSIIDYADLATNRLLVGTSTDNASTRAISCLDSTMTSASSKFITLGYSNSTYNQAEISFYLSSSGSSSNRLDLGLNGGTKMSILPSGYVGIGISNPSYGLDVSGSIRASSWLYGTIGSASQTNITSVGTLSSLNVSGSVNFNDRVYINLSGGYPSIYAAVADYNVGYLNYRYMGYTGTYGASGSISGISMMANGKIVATEFDATSDFRLKDNIKPIELDKAKRFVKNITPKTFNWKTDSKECINFGYIAQDILKADFQELIMVKQTPDINTEEYIDPIDGFVSPARTIFTISRTQIIAILHVTIKDLYNETDNIKSDNEELQNRVTNLENRINTLENENNQLKEQINNILLRLQNLENN
jgi:FtsZ-binding cell division protein ZapB